MAGSRSGGELVLHGHKANIGVKMKGYLSSSQRTSTTRHLSACAPPDSLGSPPDRSRWDDAAQPPVSRGSPDIDELERSLRELKMQVRSLASSLDLGSRTEGAGGSDMTTSTLDRTPCREHASMDWFLNPEHLVDSPRGAPQYPALQGPGGAGADRAVSPAGRLGSELISRLYPSLSWGSALDLPFSLGSPHVIGVRSLLPPDPPVRMRRPRSRAPPPRSCRGDPRDPRARSLSPQPKRKRCHHSRSHSPRPPRRPSRWGDRQPWSPYSLAPPALHTAPGALELGERFLWSQQEAHHSLLEQSPYQQELSRLRLERLHVEEDLLLQLKRQQELERTRGPREQWYAMKGPQFHYEARKNNELVRGLDQPALQHYRQELLAASQHRSHSAPWQ
ncbi:uncharacterized protein LOC131730438 isoform X1 [Acipenser ruthenus]|uniref:uncharacterized protein LOC131730438 isoform X1 n=2 Tax=Acipenser ruthenus TaxID=7906 RepID=UPI002741AD56|nr:uncharacterized protein LOC131730438 isoform X1 [Acipenser ruthenus]